MRTFVAVSLLATAFAASSASQSPPEPSRPSSSIERPFSRGGRIQMDLSAGDYEIVGGDEERIRVEWSVRDASRLADARVRVETSGANATVTTDGPRNNFHVAIRVPARSDLYVRLTAGELAVEKVEGNKDIELHAGEVDIDVGRADDYSQVEASVWAGELQAPPYQVAKEGLFRSFDWRGSGRYRLHAHLKAGELRLYSSARAAR